MSPEKAGVGARDIDTRSDIYSLGVMLYELIAGRLPADPNESGYASLIGQLATGNLRIVPPSSERSDKDLDWITMRALEADRARRYPSAAALAEDVERFLRNEPVSARRPTLGYRLSKYVRRNRAQAAAAAIAILAVTGGGIAAAAGYVRSIRAEAIARDEAATASEVSDFLVNTFKVTDPGEARGRTVTARELLQNAASQIDTRLKERPKVKQRLLTSFSSAYSSLGLYTEGQAMAEKALAGLPAVGKENLEYADALLALSAAGWQQDRFEKAREASARAVAIRTRLLGVKHPKVAEALQSLGTVEMMLDQFGPALEHMEQALAIRREALGPDHLDTGSILRSIGGVYLRRGKKGDMKLSLEHYQQSLKIIEARLGADHPLYASNLDDIGIAVNKPSEALGWHQRALAVASRQAKLGDSNTQTADAMRSLAMVEASVGRFQEALRLFERVLAISIEALGPDNENTLLERSNLGVMLAAMKRFDEALPHLRAGLRAKVFFRWEAKQYDAVRKDPRYLALVAEQERIKAGGVPESTFQYTTPK